MARTTGQSAANAAQTVSTPSGAIPGRRRLLFVTVVYSAAVSVTATVTLNSGAGAAFDALLQNIAFSANTDGVFIPDEEVKIQSDDAIDVLAPAGGVGVTSTVAIYWEGAQE